MNATSAVKKTRELLTLDEVADTLSCSRWLVYRLCRENKLELVKLGRSSRVTQRSLDLLLNDLMAKEHQ